MMRTPLYKRHIEAGARMAPFGGWDMPIQYDGILKEHKATRKHCTVFDVSHMGELRVSGPTAEADLQHLLTQDIATLENGQCRYGYLLNEDGGVLDDLTCYRLAHDEFYLVVNAATCNQDADWILDHLAGTTVFKDESPETAKLDVQGPDSRDVLEELLNTDLPGLKYFRCVSTALAGISCMLSRTGYTGEWGYEIYFPAEKAVELWDLLLDEGGIQPAGLGARDTLRLEMGYPLYGHELSLDRTPVAASRGAFVATDKPFIGRQAVERDMERGVARYLVGLKLQTRRAAREGDVVMLDDHQIGEVTSGSFAPSLGVAVAMAYVDRIYCDAGTEVEILVGDKPLAATVTELPFYREGSARGKK